MWESVVAGAREALPWAWAQIHAPLLCVVWGPPAPTPVPTQCSVHTEGFREEGNAQAEVKRYLSSPFLSLLLFCSPARLLQPGPGLLSAAGTKVPPARPHTELPPPIGQGPQVALQASVSGSPGDRAMGDGQSSRGL